MSVNDSMTNDIHYRQDARGKKLAVRRVHLDHKVRYIDPIQNCEVYSFADINLKQNTYLTTQELNQRAQSLAYSIYKLEKRAMAKKAAKKKLLWIMAVVKCKVFVTKLKRKWMMSKML